MAGPDHSNDHKHGTMPTREQEKTFAGFVRFVGWGMGISVAVLIFLALANG